jgi:hypothetical protein
VQADVLLLVLISKHALLYLVMVFPEHALQYLLGHALPHLVMVPSLEYLLEHALPHRAMVFSPELALKYLFLAFLLKQYALQRLYLEHVLKYRFPALLLLES